MNTSACNFDHDWTLAELLDARELARVDSALSTLLGGAFAIEDESAHVVWGSAIADAQRAALVLELEPIGQLCAPQTVPAASLEAAHSLLQALLRTRLSLRMAASLHQEAMAEDYLSLRTEHAHLQESETRYRDLATQLEDKVKAQVTELEARQQQLFQAARLASVGQLAAGVAHEINNPLGFMRSNLSTLSAYVQRFAKLKEQTSPTGNAWQKLDMDFVITDSHEILNECISGLDRISAIVRDLKDFSNVDGAEFGACDLTLCLQQTAALVEGQLPPGGRLELSLQPLPAFNGMRGQLNLLFLNVMRNAIQAVQAVQGPGTVKVHCESNAQRILISIQDDGIGMSTEIQQKAFDPFFTSHAVGGGVGLGLSSARSIVLAHGGSISLSSQPGVGTTVYLEFPLRGALP